MNSRVLRPAHLALLLAGLVAASTIRFGTFAPWGTDQAGYIESSRRWKAKELVAPVPLNSWPLLSDRPYAASPPAFRPGLLIATDVSVYPLGFPVMLAAAESAFGDLAPYLIAPLFAGLMVWCTYAIAARAGNEWAGLAAAFLIGMSPVTLGYSVMPMSDVPAAALCSLAWLLSFGRGLGAAIASGAVTALAVMVRPHLAPLGMVPLVLLICGGQFGFRIHNWWRGIVFCLAALPGPVLVAWSQALLYGSFDTPGYPGYEAFFRFAHVPRNLWLLPKHLATVHTPLVFLGLTAVTILFRKTHDALRLVVLSSLMLIGITFALYLPYLPYDDVYFVRFTLPALMALSVLNGIQIWRTAEWLGRRTKPLAALAVTPIAMMIWFQAPAIHYTYTVYKEQSRLIQMGHYLRAVLPANAVVFCALQSGAVQHLTRADILRFDLLEPGSLDSWIERLTSRGFAPVLVLDEERDRSRFRAHATRELSKYRWMPRAEFRSTSPVHYMVPIRRDRLDTDAGIVDVLQ